LLDRKVTPELQELVDCRHFIATSLYDFSSRPHWVHEESAAFDNRKLIGSDVSLRGEK